ncbi:MAG: hypothetical protein J6M17_13700 [Ruminococcus sp.]|nr:hypothetical protein [Ruminococcus sp.]
MNRHFIIRLVAAVLFVIGGIYSLTRNETASAALGFGVGALFAVTAFKSLKK